MLNLSKYHCGVQKKADLDTCFTAVTWELNASRLEHIAFQMNVLCSGLIFLSMLYLTDSCMYLDANYFCGALALAFFVFLVIHLSAGLCFSLTDTLHSITNHRMKKPRDFFVKRGQ
jgi:hypothetical protein